MVGRRTALASVLWLVVLSDGPIPAHAFVAAPIRPPSPRRAQRFISTRPNHSLAVELSTPSIPCPKRISRSLLFPQRPNNSALRITLRRLFSSVATSLVILGSISTSIAHAAATTTIGPAPLQSLRPKLIPWKSILKVMLSVWATVEIMFNIRVKQRQSKLATSEWSRYAKYPAARGRAILWLTLQQAFFILAAKLVRPQHSRIRKFASKQFANSLLQLGPLYIKLGQIVSCRKNLLGEEWIDAMASLQDRVPANTGDDALALAYSTLEGGKEAFDELFSEFDPTPLAAASLGQVHKATLRKNGDVVAVKVQRPLLRQIYDQDLEFLTTIATFMDQLPGTNKNVGGVKSSWTEIFKDAEEILYREIDYRDEANNAVRFAEDFGLTFGGQAIAPKARARNNQILPSAAEWLRTPYIYKDISNERLLVMEFVPSIKISNREKLDAANITMDDQIDLADALARAYLRQFCCNLFFSTDPHPGNLGVEVLENGKPRLVVYDFGQAATLTQNQADGILQIIEAIIDVDVERSIEAFIKMDVLVKGADLDKVRAKVAENYRTGKVKANRKNLRRTGYKFKEAKQGFSNTTITDTATSKDSEVMSFFSLPVEYAFVARAISQMDGVGKGLDPDFDFISNSAPYIVEIKGADKYLREEAMKRLQNIQQKVFEFQSKQFPATYNKFIEHSH